MVEISRKRRFVFNPDEETKEMLIATFAIRKDIFQKIFKIIKSSSRDTAPQHFLLIGQRGMGKTTLLLRLKYGMEDDVELKHYLLPVRFSEEQYQIGCLPDLWEETALYLENTDPFFKGLNDEMLRHEKEKDYERISFDILVKKIKEAKKRIVLLIDNIGDLFNKLTNEETHRFREILMTSPHILLIGASSQMLEHTFRYDKPFFEFFYQLKLEPLKKEEATDLMKALGGNYDVYNKIQKIIKEKPERIEVLRRITGGVPRTLVLLFEILVDSTDGGAFEDLEELTDRVSPLYKERMDLLKPQQQKIMDALARAWEPITASEVLEQSKLYRENLASNQVSAQLKQLEDNQLVETISLGKRKKAYRIRERFFNIWYLMRHGRKNTKEQVLWLIRFMENWCTLEELKEIARQQIEYLKKEGYSTKAAFYKAVALHAIRDIEPGLKKEVLKHTEAFLTKTKKNEWAKTIHDLAEDLKAETYVNRAYEEYERGNLQKAEELLQEGVAHNEPDAEYYLALFCQDVLKDFDKAEQYYLKAIKKGHVGALNELAIFYQKEKRDFDKAEQFFLKAIDKGDMNAAYNLALLYNNEKMNFDKAEEFYLKAIEEGDADALFNLAYLYENEKKDFDKAEEFYLKAVEEGDMNAPYNLALFYQSEKKDFDKAEKFYLKAIDKGDVDALNNLAVLYQNDRKDFDKAEEFFLKAIDKGDVNALNNLALFYETKKQDFDKAQIYYQKAVATGDYKALHNYAFLLLERGELNKAFDRVVELFEKEEYLKKYISMAMSLITNLLAKQQYHFLLNQYRKENSLLAKYMQPVYYVLAWFMRSELPGEYEKAGAEIKETVEEIIKAVEDIRKEQKNNGLA